MDRDKNIAIAKIQLEENFLKLKDPNAKRIIRPILDKLFEQWDEGSEMVKKLSYAFQEVMESEKE